MLAITVDIPDDFAANFATPEAIRQALFEDFFLEQRQRGAISLGQAAELLSLSYPEIFDLLGSKGLSPINASHQALADRARHRTAHHTNRTNPVQTRAWVRSLSLSP